MTPNLVLLIVLTAAVAGAVALFLAVRWKALRLLQTERRQMARGLYHIRKVDSSKSRLALQAAQKNSGFGKSGPVPAVVIGDVLKSMTQTFGRGPSSKELEAIRKLVGDLDRTSNDVITQRARPVLAAMPRTQLEALQRVPIGFLPSFDLASTMAVVGKDNTTYIAVSAGVVAYMGEALKSVLSRVHIGKDVVPAGEWKDHIARMRMLLGGISGVPSLGPMAGRVWLSDLTPAHLLIHGWMMEGAEMFIIAHEYAHLIYGHHHAESEWPEKFRLAMQREPAMAAQAQNMIRQSQEFQADKLALKIVAAALKGRQRAEAACAFAGVGAMFSLCYIMERFCGSARGYEQHMAGMLLDSSHPPSLIRRNQWEDVSRKQRGKHEREMWELAGGIHAISIRTVEDLLRSREAPA